MDEKDVCKCIEMLRMSKVWFLKFVFDYLHTILPMLNYLFQSTDFFYNSHYNMYYTSKIT